VGAIKDVRQKSNFLEKSKPKAWAPWNWIGNWFWSWDRVWGAWTLAEIRYFSPSKKIPLYLILCFKMILSDPTFFLFRMSTQRIISRIKQIWKLILKNLQIQVLPKVPLIQTQGFLLQIKLIWKIQQIRQIQIKINLQVSQKFMKINSL